MRTRRVVVIVVAAFVASLFVMNLFVPAWATAKLERGDELSLPVQVVIATSHLWARYGVVVTVILAAMLAAWLFGRRPDATKA
jgi:type II secretory pathway component PulF